MKLSHLHSFKLFSVLSGSPNLSNNCFLKTGSIATGNLNFTSTQRMDPPAHAPAFAPAPAPAPAERTNSEQSLHIGTNPFAYSLDGQETSSTHNEHNEAQSAPSNQDSRQGEGESGKKRKQSHIGSALEGHVEFKKSQTTKTLEALNEKRRRDKEFSIEKCLDEVDAMDELTDEEKSYALELFESEINRQIFIKTKNHNVRLIWLKRKFRYVALNMLSEISF